MILCRMKNKIQIHQNKPLLILKGTSPLLPLLGVAVISHLVATRCCPREKKAEYRPTPKSLAEADVDTEATRSQRRKSSEFIGKENRPFVDLASFGTRSLDEVSFGPDL